MSGLKMFGLRLNIWSEAAWPGLQFLVRLLSLGWHVRSEAFGSVLECGLTLDVWSETVGFRAELEYPA